MGAHMRTMAACFADAERGYDWPVCRTIAAREVVVERILAWQTTVANVTEREMLGIHDDPALQALHDAEHDARRAACAACEAVGLIPEMMGGLKL